jgi:hypothetical protein
VKRHSAYALAALVGASFVLRTALAWLRSVPALFPDEYIYSSIGRSIAESGRPLIRGGSAHFPALLQPIITAPAWLIGDVGTAFRVVQAIGALTMSLAAVPVFLIARRLGLTTRISLALAGFTLLVPDLLYASFISSEALAYPLALASVYAATRALAEPSRRAQLLFVGAAGLATLARAQFAVLPIVFVLATVLVGARERRVRAAVREQAFPLVLFAVAAAALLAAGLSRSVGVFRWLLGFHAGPLGIVHWAALDAMTLAYAAGWIIIPGALLGLWLALSRPRSTEELAFGVVAVLLIAALFFEAGLLQASITGEHEIQERYVFYAAPLLGLCFALYARRGWPLRLQHLALAAVLVLISVRLPLGGYAVVSTLNGSPVLFGVYWLTGKLGKPGDASAVVAAAAGLMTVVAVLGSRRHRLGTPVVLGLAMLATGAASAGAVIFDVQNTATVKKAYLPGDPSWVDRAHLGKVTLLQSFSGGRGNSLQELFWNRSITRVALLPGASKFDSYRTERVRVGDDGSLTVNGRPLDGPLLVDTYGSTVRLQDAHVLGRGPTSTLWMPDRSAFPRLRLYAPGRYSDGWLAAAGVMFVWPSAAGRPVSGWISMRLTAPQVVGAATLTFQFGRHARTTVRISPGGPRDVRIPICGSKDARVTYRSKKLTLVGLRSVSVMATAPVFTPSRSACPAWRSSGKTRLGTDVAVSQGDLVAERVRARTVVHRVEVDRHRY